MVSFGAIVGANTRFLIYNKLERLYIRNDFAILIINALASFFLGFFISILPNNTSLNFSHLPALFFLIGFLGSLSTFSTFIYDLYYLLLELEFLKAIKLFGLSFFAGIICITLGFLLGNL